MLLVSDSKCTAMVRLELFTIQICLLVQCWCSELVPEESKKIYSKVKSKSDGGKDFNCDLQLLPQQQQLMYVKVRVKKSEASVDLYKWPKNKEGYVIVPYRISKSYCECFLLLIKWRLTL